MRGQAADHQQTFASLISEKGLTYIQIYAEHWKLNSKKNSPLFKKVKIFKHWKNFICMYLSDAWKDGQWHLSLVQIKLKPRWDAAAHLLNNLCFLFPVASITIYHKPCGLVTETDSLTVWMPEVQDQGVSSATPDLEAQGRLSLCCSQFLVAAGVLWRVATSSHRLLSVCVCPPFQGY